MLLKRLFKTLLALILIVSAGLAFYFYQKLPQRDGSLSLASLDQPVDVWFDTYGIPHIQAQTMSDLFLATGYLHAQDRLFQMEITRRLSQGKLAEILGQDLVSVDTLFRRLSIAHHAKTWSEHIQQTSDPEMLIAINRYLQGVNQYAVRNRPIEFDILGIPDHDYQLEDILSIAGYMSWSFAQGTKEDPIVEFVATTLGTQYLEDLATHSGHQTREIPVTGPDLIEVANLYQPVNGIAPFIGSNGWVLSGEKTESGKPVFANDPHIGFAQPSVWWEAYLHAPGFEIYGHFLSLVPFPLLGHNSNLAWGLTMFENDDVDLYQEILNPDNPNQYRYQQSWLDFDLRREVIQVKNASDITIEVKTSRHGPLIHQSMDHINPESNTGIAIWWQFLEPGNGLIDAFWQLPSADTLAKAYRAAESIHAPGLNLMYANRTGDIAWFAAGKVPLRPAHVNSKRILDGASGKDDHQGFLPFSQNPMAVNPDIGYIYTANNQPAALEGQNPVPGYYAPRDRADRIQTWMVGSAKHDTTSMKMMLLDNKSVTATRLIGLLKEALGDQFESVDEGGKHLALKMYNWDTSHDPTLIEPTLYNRFRQELQQAIFLDELGNELYSPFKSTFLLDRSLWRVTANKNSIWWDDTTTTEAESWRDIITHSWVQAVNGLRTDLGSDPDPHWQWKNASLLIHSHPLGSVEPLDKLLNVGPFASAGGVETINNLSVKYDQFPYRVSHGPSTRRIVDFGSPQESVGINPTGQSGYWLDSHYKDQAMMYAQGEFRPQLMAKPANSSQVQSELRIVPE